MPWWSMRSRLKSRKLKSTGTEVDEKEPHGDDGLVADGDEDEERAIAVLNSVCDEGHDEQAVSEAMRFLSTRGRLAAVYQAMCRKHGEES